MPSGDGVGHVYVDYNMVDGVGPRRPAKFIPPLKKVELDGTPIEMWFPIPLDASQREEITGLLRPLLSHAKRRVTVTCDKVVIEGLLARDSKPVRDTLARVQRVRLPEAHTSAGAPGGVVRRMSPGSLRPWFACESRPPVRLRTAGKAKTAYRRRRRRPR